MKTQSRHRRRLKCEMLNIAFLIAQVNDLCNLFLFFPVPISITLQTFVTYHIRESLYSVNALLYDPHTSTHTELYIYINA